MPNKRINPRGKVFRDPVHRLIRIQPGDEFILKLIDTPVFQRLRRIRQLGVSWMTYHGAEHSRFSHSMGVFNFAQRILCALKERYKEEGDLVEYFEKHERELKAAALLHDIGHSPFSHMLERAFDGSIDHEKKTKELICDGDIARILGDEKLNPQNIAEITQGSKGTSNDRLIVDIVSSQLDADRMDYLLRDSMHTGVEYGTYDAEWLIRNLCIGRDPHSQHDGDHRGYAHHRLCLDRARGVHTAEQLIMARLHMIMQVYMHRVTRGYETLLLNLFRLAAQLAKEDKLLDGTPAVVNAYFVKEGILTHEEWLRFDEMAMFAAISDWASNGGSVDKNLQRMASAFLRRERILKCKDICDAQAAQIMKLTTELNKVVERGIEWELDDGEVLPYKGLRYEAAKSANDTEEQSAQSILLANGEVEDRAVAVDTESAIFQTLDFKAQKISRIYYDYDKAAVIEKVFDDCGIGG